MKTTTIAILADRGKYYVTCTVGGREYALGRYATAGEAGKRMASWVRDRGLCFAPDTASRIAAAPRADDSEEDSGLLIFDVITRVEYDAHVRPAEMAWVPFASDYIFQL